MSLSTQPACRPSVRTLGRTRSMTAGTIGRRRHRPLMERLEDRTVLSVTLGTNYPGLDFNASGGYVPPDTNGAVSNTTYVETVNQTVALFDKASGSKTAQSSLGNFWFTTGGLPHASTTSGLSDPVVTFNNQIGRYIVGDQDVDFSKHVSRFDLAVSASSDPATLSTSDWTFYSIVTTQSGYDADFPGNFGYNADAFVVTLNMFGTNSDHVQVLSVSNSDLQSGAASPAVYHNNLNDFAVRPTVMHDSVAGDPMWLLTEHGDNKSIDVINMSNVLSSSATFTYTNLPVTPYSNVLNPLNPNSTVITTNIDGRIQKSAEANNTIVASHAVAVSGNEDDIQWYAIDVSTGTPTLKDQGRVGSGSQTYSFYPAIDINANGQIGLTYMKSGNDSPSDYMSMYVTGRLPSDSAGTMETPVLVTAGAGQANYTDFANPGHRAGDLSGISVDPVDGSFWAANEFANTEANANWGTAIANFSLGSPLPPANLAVSFTATPPSSIDVTSGAQIVSYTISFANNGPNAASNVVLTDTLPAGATNASLVPSGADSFSITQSGGTFIVKANGPIASGSSDTFTITVTAPGSLANGAAFNDTASVTSSNPDSNTGNNSATATSTIVNNNAFSTVSVSVSGPASGSEGGSFKYQITVKNTGSIAATGVVLTDTLASLLNYTSATTTLGTFSYSSGVVTFTIGTINAGSTVTATVTAQGVEDGSATSNASVTGTNVSPVNAGATTAISEPVISVSSAISRYGRTFSNIQTATFTHASGVEPTSAFAATINWGDGTTSLGTITFSSGTYRVAGSHTYTSQGNHTIKTTVAEVGSAPNSPAGEAGNKVDVSPARLPWWQRDIVQLPRWYRTHPKAAHKLLARLQHATSHHAAPASRLAVHTKPRHYS